MAFAMNDMNNVPASPANGYFVDQKKGEVNELKQVHMVMIQMLMNNVMMIMMVMMMLIVMMLLMMITNYHHY